MPQFTDIQMPVPNTSMLPPEPPPDLPLAAAAVGAAGALQAKQDRLRATGDAWAEGLRGTVRGNPLVSIVGALALGLVLGRIGRIARGRR